jgi:hypothetical protein
VEIGRLHPLHRGVYAVGHSHVERRGRLRAATLAFPDGAVLSHRTAGEEWQILRPTSTRPNVTSDERTLHGRPGIVLHRVRSLDPALRTEVNGLPVTTVERVLLDLASLKDLTPLRRAWEGAQRERLLDVDKVIELVENSPGRRVKPLKALIEEALDAPDTIEEFEARFADSSAGVPTYRPRLTTSSSMATWSTSTSRAPASSSSSTAVSGTGTAASRTRSATPTCTSRGTSSTGSPGAPSPARPTWSRGGSAGSWR